MEECCNGAAGQSFLKEWIEIDKRYSLERKENGAGCFLLCVVIDVEGKNFLLVLAEGKGLCGGWIILVEKLRDVGVRILEKVEP